MRTKNFFVAKLVAVTLMLGLFSPTINIQDGTAPEKVASMTELHLSEGVLDKLSTSEFTFTLFNQAEARKHKKIRRKARRKARRRAHRRANYRHHRRHHHHHRRRNNAGAVIGAAVVGAVVGAAVNEASKD